VGNGVVCSKCGNTDFLHVEPYTEPQPWDNARTRWNILCHVCGTAMYGVPQEDMYGPPRIMSFTPSVLACKAPATPGPVGLSLDSKEVVMDPMSLQPLDAITSFKRPPAFLVNPPKYFFETILLSHSKRTYSNWQATHVRLVVGQLGDRMIGFEWTFPAARFFEIEPWMLESDYASVYRWNNPVQVDEEDVFQACLPYNGTMYDVLQPLGILLNFRRWFDGGKRNLVCSVGVRTIWEQFYGTELFSEVSLQCTLPCSFMNHPELCGKLGGM
jgi:hypothetical protein